MHVRNSMCLQVVEGLHVKGDKAAAAKQIHGLYDLFVKSDCTMVEVGAGRSS